MDSVPWNVRKEKFAFLIHGRPFCKTVALADHLPRLIRQENSAGRMLLPEARSNRRGIIVPQPAERIGQDRPALLAIVSAIAPNVVHVITGELQGREHLLIRQKPISAINVLIIASILKEHANWLWLGFSNESRILVPAAQAHIRADRAEHFAECF